MPAISNKPESIRVVARCRPLSGQEVADGLATIVSVTPPSGVRVAPDTDLSLDQAFGPDSTQDEVFDLTAKPLIDAVLEGYNGTVFAYGQTGSGKTFTMEGSDDAPGIMPRTFEHLAQRIAALSVACDYVVYLSFLEIYNDEVIDLLVKGKGSGAKLDVKESKERGIYVNGLGQHVVQGEQDMMRKLQLGKRNRKVGETKMNQESSRSHSILTLTIVRVEGTEATAAAAAAVNPPKPAKPAPGPASHKAAAAAPKPAKAVGKVSVGKLHLVDLAGSERSKKTGAAGDRLKEGIAINKSLTALGNVMSALCDGKSGALVPYRESKLTRLLQDSLGGNSKTVMVANVGPADWNSEETLSTLKYAARARSIKNAPKVNNDPADAMVKQYREQVEKLHAEYQVKIAKMEEMHAAEVQQLKEELQAIHATRTTAAQGEEAARVTALQKQLEELQLEKARRQQQEQEVEVLKNQLLQLQLQADQQAAAAAEEQQQKQAAEAEAAAAATRALPALVTAAAAEDNAPAAAAASPTAAGPGTPKVATPKAAAATAAAAKALAPVATGSPKAAAAAAAAAEGAASGSPRTPKAMTAKSLKEIADLKNKIRQMQKEAIGDYQYMLQQSDELARLKAKVLEEAGLRTQADDALEKLQQQLAAVHGTNAGQDAEVRRMQGLMQSLQARGVRPQTAAMRLEVVIQGDEQQAPQAPQQRPEASGRSLREDPGCNMLFEELVLDMGYDAEAARQAIMVMPGGTLEEIIDYIIDKEALFEAWRRFKSSLA